MRIWIRRLWVRLRFEEITVLEWYAGFSTIDEQYLVIRIDFADTHAVFVLIGAAERHLDDVTLFEGALFLWRRRRDDRLWRCRL